MESILLPSSLVLQLPACQCSPRHKFVPQHISFGSSKHLNHISSPPLSHPFHSSHSWRVHQSSIDAIAPSDEGPVSVIDFEDFAEKDWSFLDSDDLNSKQNHQKIGRIISAGGIKETSRVLVSIGSEGFVEQLAETSPCSLLLVTHDSLFLLACIKEKYDTVKCWQGELIHLPERWAALDVVFLYFLPALPFKLDQVLETLAKRCSPGARVVISHPQGRETLQQQRKQYQDVIVSDLPDKMTLEKTAANHLFEVAEFLDEPGFYLAVLQFSENGK